MQCELENDEIPAGAYRRVQGLARGLAILEALNAQPGAHASVIELSRTTGLHRTTVKRSLETMRHAGYVQYSSHSNCYCVTFRVRRLSDNFRDETWISEVASLALRQLTAKILWPSDLLTLSEDHFVVRDTTHPLSPLSFSTGVFGTWVPILTSAVGRAYLANCPAQERTILLEILSRRPDEEGARARDAHYVRRIVEATRQRGYAVNERGEGRGSGRLGVIAVPVMASERVLGCINIVFLMRAISVPQIVERHLTELQATARQIEAGVARLQRAGQSKLENFVRASARRNSATTNRPTRKERRTDV